MNSNEYAEKIIAVLVSRLDGHVTITNEEIEDAPSVLVKDLFETDEVEIRTLENSTPRLSKWLEKHNSLKG